MTDLAALGLALVLLAGNAFFVGAEFALVSARRTQIEPRAAAGGRSARITLRAMEQVSSMMAGAQLGITVCSLGLGALGEPAVAHLLERPLEAVGAPPGVLHPLAFAIALAIVVFAHMVLGEMVPKNIALAGPERSAMALGPLLYGLVVVLRPLIFALNRVANTVLRLLRVQPRDEVATTFTPEEVAGLLAESRREGLLDEQEHALLTGALGFAEQSVTGVALAVTDLVTVPEHATPDEVEQACVSTGYSRFPVQDRDGRLIGYVHTKDLLGLSADDRDRPMDPRVIRPLATVEANQTLREVLQVMQNRGAHLARVVDTHTGDVAGIVALEDVLEKLVGQVSDATQNLG
ncbi:hemolysin family protein [Phytoactinopolyspora halotolerans]|uniref:HlyC/CorC family transporter n=1 Tax=Phytoactinopolyspora halotolerans TaxID=1981512 RepID=A0A6L9SEU4_9ACTN|nr:hemolysin family protein [Phytoactinopolyspora halotolerans]NEE03609.1 HlyC/CorC family transporter [Phytoactinopolyspora halotolerans]